MKVLKESIELIRMEIMLAWYWHLKLKLIKYVCKMADYVAGNEFQTLEARERLRNIYRICEKESRSDADGSGEAEQAQEE